MPKPNAAAAKKGRPRKGKKVTRLELLKAELETRFGGIVGELKTELQRVKTANNELAARLQATETRLAAEDVHLRELISKEVLRIETNSKEALNGVHAGMLSRLKTIEASIRDVSREVQLVPDKVRVGLEGVRAEWLAAKESMEQRLASSDTAAVYATIETLAKSFREYAVVQQRRDTATTRLEQLVLDMEERVWPWRTCSNQVQPVRRAVSPPQPQTFLQGYTVAEETLALRESPSRPQSAKRGSSRPGSAGREEDVGSGWMPWRAMGPLITKPASRPSSRPSSARFRRREEQETSRGSSFSAGPGLQAARAARPPLPTE